VTITVLLILHSLVAVALLGAITHQVASMLWRRNVQTESFFCRYTAVSQGIYTKAVVYLYLAAASLGALLYPNYRLNVRIPFEEMALGWAVGSFELKEHFAGIGVCLLPFYAYTWCQQSDEAFHRDRIAVTLLVAFIVWLDFLVGHVLNNIRGLA
jgi:hypothetical protein